MIEVHLYGKLRRFAHQKGIGDTSVVTLPAREEEALGEVLARAGIPEQEISNVFVNGELSKLNRAINEGDRIGVFPEDMSLLYI